MPKNIVIFSDGTGQSSGIKFDERRSNIYKLYRAMRCGPDSEIDARAQIAYYDPGIGTVPDDLGFLWSMYRRIHNVVSQATGLGITTNIRDCYREILKVHEPGDRIILFGFSRGAYTVRCLASVLSHCGVPTQMADGTPLLRDNKTLDAIAYEAVTKIYQHVGSERQEEYIEQRKELGKLFRQNHASSEGDISNANPYYIGVFETVAAIANRGSIILATGVFLFAIFGISGLSKYFLATSFWNVALGLAALTAVASMYFYLNTHLKIAREIPNLTWWNSWHVNSLRMRFADNKLNKNVQFARHALAIDEYRKDFDRVKWGNPKEEWPHRPGNLLWFKQIWFAGNHSDIGGSYPENESRLSDIALQWMIEEIKAMPERIFMDESVLRLSPDHRGMQHDETKGFIFKYAARIDRTLVANATLHPSVEMRFKEKLVLQSDELKPYRPVSLKDHVKLAVYYQSNATLDIV